MVLIVRILGRGLSGVHCEGLGPEDCLVLIVRVLGLRTVVLTVRADIDFHIFNEHVYVLNFGGSLQ